MPNGKIVVLIRDEYGLTKRTIPELIYRFQENGQVYEHVDTAKDGTWIYQLRSY